jgi:hypothetical protein
LELNDVALSVMILIGHPNLDKILSSKNWMITTYVAYLVGIASIHLVK